LQKLVNIKTKKLELKKARFFNLNLIMEKKSTSLQTTETFPGRLSDLNSNFFFIKMPWLCGSFTVLLSFQLVDFMLMLYLNFKHVGAMFFFLQFNLKNVELYKKKTIHSQKKCSFFIRIQVKYRKSVENNTFSRTNHDLFLEKEHFFK
jgi:hypothetical protein